MSDIRICIVGAGSSYTPELIGGILASTPEELPIAAIHMHDVDPHRLEVMAGLSARMIRRSGRSIALRSDLCLDPMLEGADFVITQIRVGGMDARAKDERIPLKYGVIGQETTGPGGMAKALRTIPRMLEIVRQAQRIAPKAYVLNYTNPSGIIAEAMCKHTTARFIGLCSGIPAMQDTLAQQLREPYPDLRTYCVGLNHLGFIHQFISGGRNVTKEAIEYLYQHAKDKGAHGPMADLETARFFNAIPITYLYYYLNRRKMVVHQLEQKITRAEQIKVIEGETFREAADPALDTKPKALQQRGGAGYADVTFAVMKAILHDTGAEIVASVLNQGAVAGIPDDAAVEIVCRVDKAGLLPLPVGEIPLAFRGLVQSVKTYETLTVEAAVTGSKHLALQALVAHPLVGDVEVAKELLDDLIAAHGLELR